MPKSTSRSQSNAELLQETTQNLYNLGLLNDNPRTRDRFNGTAPNRATQRKTFPGRIPFRNPYVPRAVSGIRDFGLTLVFNLLDSNPKGRYQPSVHRGPPSVGGGSFKQASISGGTLGRPRTPERRPVTKEREHRTAPSPTASVPGAGHPMASMLDSDRSRSRRERTFVGGECAVCGELLEHTLRGERVLQFSCGHVAHEACFYEYIKESDAQSQYCPTCDAPLGLDSFRGGSILDLSTIDSALY
jgi:hypothetical protein